MTVGTSHRLIYLLLIFTFDLSSTSERKFHEVAASGDWGWPYGQAQPRASH